MYQLIHMNIERRKEVNYKKQALLYLKRKKSKTASLFLLIVVMSTLLITCISILFTTDQIAMNMRSSIGAAIHVRSNAALDTQESNYKTSIKDSSVQDIMADKNFKYYNGKNNGYVTGIDFIPGLYDSSENNMGRILGNNYSILHQNFVDKKFELIDGRHIRPNDQNTLLISDTLALYNQLSVGDEIEFSPANLDLKNGNFINTLKESNIKETAKIIGIYHNNEYNEADASYQPTAELNENQIFSDHLFLEHLQLARHQEYDGGVSFYIQDPQKLDDAITKLEANESIDWNDFFLQRDNFGYEKIAEDLQIIQNLILSLTIAVSLVSAAVLFLMMTLRIRGRIHEFGIFISVGISKKDILKQLLFEILLYPFSHLYYLLYSP